MFSLRLVGVIFIAFCVLENEAAVTDAQRSNIHTKLLTSGLECMKDFPLEMKDFNALRNRQIPDAANVKCFLDCIYKQLGVIDAEGKISEKKAKKTAKTVFKDDDDTLKKADELIQKCMHVNDEELSGDDKSCERAYLATKCYMEEAPKVGLDIISMYT